MTVYPIDIAEFEDCIQDWFAQATGLLTIWRQQGRIQPKLPYAGLHTISGPQALAPQWELRRTTDLTRPLGKEIEIEYCVPAKFDISCQIYAPPDFDDHGTMCKAMAALSTISQQEKFHAKNIAMVNYSPIRCIAIPVNLEYQARVNMDVVFLASLSIKEYTGYISSVECTSDSLQIDVEI